MIYIVQNLKQNKVN